MVINLGTNDSPSGATGICPNKNFSDATIAFVLNAARVYRNPALPVSICIYIYHYKLHFKLNTGLYFNDQTVLFTYMLCVYG